MLKDIFVSTIDKYKMLSPGDKVLIALSGGMDSVCMYSLFQEIKDEYKLKLYVVHINHGLRKASMQDENFVKNLVKNDEVHFICERIKIKVKSNIEEQARDLRYNIFTKICKKYKIKKVAIAHNADDKIETMLMWMIRGCGKDALEGIPYKRLIESNKGYKSNEVIIRPILDVFRKNIEKYIKAKKLEFCVDHTNFETDFFRNRIRLKLLPYLKKYNSKVKENLFKLMSIISEENVYINGIVDGIYPKIVSKKGKHIIIALDEYLVYNIAIQQRLLYKACKGYISFEQVEKLLDLLKNRQGNFTFSLKKGLYLYKEYNKLVLSDKPAHEKFKTSKKSALKLNGTTIFGDYVFKTSIIKKAKNFRLSDIKNNEIVGFDYSYLKNKRLFFRHWEKGDFFYPFGMKGKKKLQDYFADNKMPKQKRKKIPLLVMGNEVLWVSGQRRSSSYVVNEKTKEILCIRLHQEEKF